MVEIIYFLSQVDIIILIENTIHIVSYDRTTKQKQTKDKQTLNKDTIL